MWSALGFKQNPYDTSPLKSKSEDVGLLIGRDHESIEFCTIIESSEQGIYIISGAPGVGKTSFFNIQQYLLETGDAVCGPSLLCARELCPVQPKDTAQNVALRVIYSLHRSVEDYCNINGLPLPKETKKIGSWLHGKGGSGFDIGLQILGFGGNIGRQIEVPSIRDITFEGLRDVINCIVGEVVNTLKKDGVFIVLDNIENLEDQELSNILITFRDTLFSIPKVWWVIIGQSGLGSLIQSLDPRVSDRLSGTGLELKPITLDNLYKAIEGRVDRFHSVKNGKAPLTPRIHEHLYRASHGEIRFVFKYCGSICTQFIKLMRIELAKTKTKIDEKSLNGLLGEHLVKSQIKESVAQGILKSIIRTELDGLNLRHKEKELLKHIGERGSARAKDFKDLGFKTMQELSSNYLSKLHKQHLLARKQEGRAVQYRLRGLSSLASEFGLLEK